MAKKVVKSTSKGQITLPKSWRSQFGTDTFILDMQGEKLIVKALDLTEKGEELEEEGEEVLWSAEKDNNGKGLDIEEVIALLKKVQDE